MERYIFQLGEGSYPSKKGGKLNIPIGGRVLWIDIYFNWGRVLSFKKGGRFKVYIYIYPLAILRKGNIDVYFNINIQNNNNSYICMHVISVGGILWCFNDTDEIGHFVSIMIIYKTLLKGIYIVGSY